MSIGGYLENIFENVTILKRKLRSTNRFAILS